jgi:hypothetical protein
MCKCADCGKDVEHEITDDELFRWLKLRGDMEDERGPIGRKMFYDAVLKRILGDSVESIRKEFKYKLSGGRFSHEWEMDEASVWGNRRIVSRPVCKK